MAMEPSESHRRRHSGHVFEQDDGDKVLYACAAVSEDEEGVLKQKNAEAKASVLHQERGRDEVDFLQAKAGAWKTVAGAGVSASVNLADMKAGGFEAKLGVGVDTGIGLRDGSLTAQVLGTGVTVGRKIKISILGIESGVDLGRLFSE